MLTAKPNLQLLAAISVLLGPLGIVLPGEFSY